MIPEEHHCRHYGDSEYDTLTLTLKVRLLKRRQSISIAFQAHRNVPFYKEGNLWIPCQMPFHSLGKQHRQVCLGFIPGSRRCFQKGRSTTTNLLMCMNARMEALDKAEPVDVAYLDCEKAFGKYP